MYQIISTNNFLIATMYNFILIVDSEQSVFVVVPIQKSNSKGLEFELCMYNKLN